MRYSPNDPRYDDPLGVSEHEGRYEGGTALVVLGGYSALEWRELHDGLKPDVLIGANGVNGMVYGLDYWLMCENLTRSARMAAHGDADSIAIMDMFNRDAGAKNRMVSHRSYDRLTNKENVVRIRRQGYEVEEVGEWFSFRKYGLGFLAGGLLKNKEVGAEVHVGTVGLQCIHMAGILGCSHVHTIGYDLQFRDHEHHHAYEYPVYQVDKFRTPKMFISHNGVPTQQVWVETAQYLKSIEYIFDRDGLKWRDHSDGLLKLEGLECAK